MKTATARRQPAKTALIIGNLRHQHENENAKKRKRRSVEKAYHGFVYESYRKHRRSLAAGVTASMRRRSRNNGLERNRIAAPAAPVSSRRIPAAGGSSAASAESGYSRNRLSIVNSRKWYLWLKKWPRRRGEVIGLRQL